MKKRNKSNKELNNDKLVATGTGDWVYFDVPTTVPMTT